VDVIPTVVVLQATKLHYLLWAAHKASVSRFALHLVGASGSLASSSHASHVRILVHHLQFHTDVHHYRTTPPLSKLSNRKQGADHQPPGKEKKQTSSKRQLHKRGCGAGPEQATCLSKNEFAVQPMISLHYLPTCCTSCATRGQGNCNDFDSIDRRSKSCLRFVKNQQTRDRYRTKRTKMNFIQLVANYCS
jgi:hypothetical protein